MQAPENLAKLFFTHLTERLTVIPIKKVPQLKLIYSVACSSILELSHLFSFQGAALTFVKVRFQDPTSQLDPEICS